MGIYVRVTGNGKWKKGIAGSKLTGSDKMMVREKIKEEEWLGKVDRETEEEKRLERESE